MAPILARSLQFPRAHPAWTSVLGIIALLVILLALFNWNWLRGPLERVVSERTGREFRIGELDVDFFPLEVHAGKLRFANARWSEEKTMARAEQLDLRVRFWPLLGGRLDLARLELDHPFLRIERNTQGEGNWQFGETPAAASREESRASRLRIRQLQVSDGRFELREPRFGTSIDVGFNSGKPQRAGALAPLQFQGKGEYRKAPFELAGKVDSPLALQGKERPYHIDVRARAGETRARARGGLIEPLRLQNGSVNLEISGADLAQLYEFTGIVLPTTPPYAFRGSLNRKGREVSYRKFTGTVGDSDLSGDATVHLGERLKLTAVLQSRQLDFDDLAGFIGATPATGAGETASAQQEQERSAQKASGKIFPSKPIQLARLRSMDADVQLTAARINSPRLPLEDMKAHLKLADGKVILDPLDFGAAGGSLASVVQLDAREDPAKFGIAMQIEGLELPKILPKAKVMSDSIGTLQGAVEISGQGNSTASILASSDGTVGMIMGEGRISNLVLEVAGLDIAESLKFLIGKDQEVRLRCAYADFGLEDGIATARSVAMDTTDTALIVRGDIDLGKESLDLRLLPKPKDFSPVSIRSPILIGGTFADPSVAPEAEPLLLRGAAVAALVAIAPPLGLLGLIETGPGKDLDCGPEVPPSRQSKSKQKAADKAGPRSPS